MTGEGEAWRRANHHLHLHLPEGPRGAAWRSFASELFRQVEVWEEQEKRHFRPNAWDFCIIHSKHPADTERAGTLKTLLENSLGLYGRTLGDVEAGECTLEAAEAMVEGSTKVFILATKYMNRIDVPKYIFQEVLMDEIRQKRWRCKVIPLVERGQDKRPFGLRGINGLILGDDPSTAEMVSREIPVETQMEVRAARRRAEAIHHERVTRLRASRHQEIREVVGGLRQRFGDNYDPTSQLDQMTEALRSMTLAEVPGVDQLVNVKNCSNVNVGPSIHFTVKYDPSTPSDHDHTSSATTNHVNTSSAHSNTPPPSRYTPTATSTYTHYNYDGSSYEDLLSSTHTVSTCASSVTHL